MIVTYATKGYIKWVYYFLKSLKETNGEKYPVVINLRDASDKDINNIKRHYSNIITLNSCINLKKLSKKHKIPFSILVKSKKDCEANIKGARNRLWMNITADEDRIIAFNRAINTFAAPFYMHIDVDNLFMNDISPLISTLEGNDISLVYRGGNNKAKNMTVRDSSFIPIGLVMVSNNLNGKNFISSWVKNISSVDLKTRKDYFWGQVAIYNSYKRFNQKINIATIPKEYLDYSCTNRDAILWLPKKLNKTLYLNVFDKNYPRG